MIFPALVIGSGPCGAACFAKLRGLGVDAWMLDPGRGPTEATLALADQLTRLPSQRWPVVKIQRNKNGQNLKTWLGDDFSTNDDHGVYSTKTALKGSHAFGGLSWVWGCSVARWPDLQSFPLGMEAAYDWLDRNVAVAGSGDLSAIARRWQTRAEAISNSQLAMADPRLAVDASRCLRCGMCMGGCPIKATWVASDWVSTVAPRERVLLGWRVDRVLQHSDHVEVFAVAADGSPQRWLAKEVFIAAGVSGSAAIALGSNEAMETVRLTDPRYIMGFALVSGHITAGLGEEDDHALAKLKLTDHATGIYWQAYTRMPQTDAILSMGLPARWARPLSRRLGILQGFLSPGSGSAITVRREGRGFHAEGTFDRNDRSRLRAGLAMLRDQWQNWGAYPLPGAARLGHAGESQHAGCGLSMGKETDALGRLPGQPHIHYVDPIVLPKLIAAPHTWTAMANAARIAEASRSV